MTNDMQEMNQQSTERHPLLKIDERVEREGLVVIDDVTSMPIYGEAYISPYAIIALCERGTVNAEYDMKPVEFHPHDFCMMRANHIVKTYETSADYRARLIVMSDAFIEKFKQLNVYRFNARLDYLIQHPQCHLTDGQFRQINDTVSLLKTVSLVGRSLREEMVLNVFHTLIMLRHEFNPLPDKLIEDDGRHLAERFRQAVVDHYRESREVSFYARLFNLSPKYFSTLIRQETGMTAGEWIDRYVVLQAKSLLARRRSLTIQQMSDLLGFTEQAAFSRFFKKQTGQSPSEFREA